jgi:hypothetical protein
VNPGVRKRRLCCAYGLIYVVGEQIARMHCLEPCGEGWESGSEGSRADDGEGG